MVPLYLKLGNSNQSLTSKETAQESTLSYRSDRGKIAGLKYFYFVKDKTWHFTVNILKKLSVICTSTYKSPWCYFAAKFQRPNKLNRIVESRLVVLRSVHKLWHFTLKNVPLISFFSFYFTKKNTAANSNILVNSLCINDR